MSNVLPGLSVSSYKVTAEVIIDLRLVDPSTSELIYSSKGSGKASQTGVSADLTKDDKAWSAGGTTATPLGQASRDALQEAVKALLAGMPKIAWTGRVIDAVQEKFSTAKITKGDGIKRGLVLRFKAP